MPKKNKKILLSIVTFHSDLDNLKKLFQNNIHELIFFSIFDNSLDKAYILSLINLIGAFKNVKYYSVNKNIGFGKAHNNNIFHHNHDCYYSIILNPDVIIDKSKVFDLISSFKKIPNNSIKILSPLLLNSDNSAQNFIRILPNFLDFIFRIFNIKQVNYAEKLLYSGFNHYIDVPIVHGAIFVIRTSHFKKLNGFSSDFFLYCEDLDFCSKLYDQNYNVFVDPNIKVTHLHNRASRRSFYLAITHLFSILKYLRKWGYTSNKLCYVNHKFYKQFSRF